MLLVDFWEVEGILHSRKVKEIEIDCKNKVIKNKGFSNGERVIGSKAGKDGKGLCTRNVAD